MNPKNLHNAWNEGLVYLEKNFHYSWKYIYSTPLVQAGLVGFYGISTIEGYLMPYPLYTYILNIYDLVWLGFMVYQPLLAI